MTSSSRSKKNNFNDDEQADLTGIILGFDKIGAGALERDKTIEQAETKSRSKLYEEGVLNATERQVKERAAVIKKSAKKGFDEYFSNGRRHEKARATDRIKKNR